MHRIHFAPPGHTETRSASSPQKHVHPDRRNQIRDRHDSQCTWCGQPAPTSNADEQRNRNKEEDQPPKRCNTLSAQGVAFSTHRPLLEQSDRRCEGSDDNRGDFAQISGQGGCGDNQGRNCSEGNIRGRTNRTQCSKVVIHLHAKVARSKDDHGLRNGGNVHIANELNQQIGRKEPSVCGGARVPRH